MADLGSRAGTAATRPARLAVDLGVSSVKMAWFEDGRIVDSSTRHVEFPAVVAAQGDDLLVGRDTHTLTAINPAAVLLDVREWLGYVPSVRLAGTEVKIEEAVTALYRAAARVTVHTTDQPPSVIVHPAPWPERRVLMLTAAAVAAGLDVVRVVPDAVAVAAAGPREGDVVVIDVGSSLTVSVVDAAADPPRILWSRTSTGAGGEAIAHAIRAVAHVPVDRARQLARGAELHTSETPLDWSAIRRQADDGVVAAENLINEVLRSSNRDGGAIARVYITGGASVAPFVREAVNNRFGSGGIDKVAEFSGPAASAAYGALRMNAPEQFRNVWSSVERKDAPQPEPTPTPNDVVAPNEWAGAPRPTPSGPVSNAWQEQSVTPPTNPERDLNAWDPAASASATATSTDPAAPSAGPTAGWAGRTAAGPSTTPLVTVRRTPVTSRRRRVTVAIALIVLLVLLLAIGVVWALAAGDDEPGSPATTAQRSPGTTLPAE